MRRVAWLLALPLAACAHAGFEEARVFRSPGLFTLGDPGAGWHLQRNVRWGSRYLVDYRRDDADVDLRVTVHPLDEETRKLPLLAIAEGVALKYGKERELETTVDAIERVDFGDHEGVVLAERRYWVNGPRIRPETALALDPEREDESMATPSPTPTPASPFVPMTFGGAKLDAIPIGKPGRLLVSPGVPPPGYQVERRLLQAFVKTRERVLMLTYVAPPDLYERYAPEVESALARFAILDDPRPPEIGVKLPSDLPRKPSP